MVRAVFIHLPKTGGTSLTGALQRGFGAHAVSPAFAASVMTEDDAERLSRYDVITGHISWTDARRLFPDAILLTVLRDPIERCLSWYHFARGLGPTQHIDVEAARAHDVDAFFDLDDEILFRAIQNRQVRQLGDHALNARADMDAALERARETLGRCAWIGRQEHLEADLSRLGAIFPEMAGVTLDHLNTTPDRAAMPAPDAALRSKVARHNRYDLKLYEELDAIAGG